MKALQQIHRPRGMHWVGDGFPVRSLFDYQGLGRELSPFLLLDYAAPYEFAPGDARRGVGAHPHRGFETVTIVYEGELEHRDSSGGGGLIGPGDVQWMTAGRGIVHEEFHAPAFVRRGGTLHMVQLWVNLRAADKMAPPAYQTLLAQDIPVVALPKAAGRVHVIAGAFGERRGPARTFTPMHVWNVEAAAGATVELPVPDGHTTTFLVVQGRVEVAGREANHGDLAVFARTGDAITFRAVERSRVLLLAGEPIDEPMVGHGPFVMNTFEEIRQAFDDYQSGRMGGLD
jgi:quercetin 2,3-dioxygenase